jgi:hypothetical protein
VLYASHSLWQLRAEFEAGTRSAAFRAAHRDAGEGRSLSLGHPEFEGFDSLEHVAKRSCIMDVTKTTAGNLKTSDLDACRPGGNAADDRD